MNKPVEMNKLTGSKKAFNVSIVEDGYLRNYGGMLAFGRWGANKQRFELAVAITDVKAFLGDIGPTTNADRIRAMSDEELAELCESGCPPGQVCPEYVDEMGLKSDCIRHWLDWLQSPAEGGLHDGN